jgi:hypothetical protein
MSLSFRDRDRKPGRRVPFRDPRPIILIVCEGKNTEPEYLEGFWKACQNPRVKIEPVGGIGAPLTLVQVARDRKRRADKNAKREGDENLKYDQVWCVFDIDNHPHVPEAKLLAAEHGIQLAISNESFELWLLLHFRESPGAQNRKDLMRMLKQYVPNYDKHVDYAKDFHSRYDNAKRRAKALCDFAAADAESGRNPTTTIYLLTHEIEQKK